MLGTSAIDVKQCFNTFIKKIKPISNKSASYVPVDFSKPFKSLTVFAEVLGGNLTELNSAQKEVLEMAADLQQQFGSTVRFAEIDPDTLYFSLEQLKVYAKQYRKHAKIPKKAIDTQQQSTNIKVAESVFPAAEVDSDSYDLKTNMPRTAPHVEDTKHILKKFSEKIETAKGKVFFSPL